MQKRSRQASKLDHRDEVARAITLICMRTPSPSELEDADPLTPLERQVVEFRRSLPAHVILMVACGYRVKVYGRDSHVLSRRSGVLCIPAKPFEYSSVPYTHVDLYVHRLVAMGYHVCFADQESSAVRVASGVKSGVFSRSLSQIYSRGTLLPNERVETNGSTQATTGDNQPDGNNNITTTSTTTNKNHVMLDGNDGPLRSEVQVTQSRAAAGCEGATEEEEGEAVEECSPLSHRNDRGSELFICCLARPPPTSASTTPSASTSCLLHAMLISFVTRRRECFAIHSALMLEDVLRRFHIVEVVIFTPSLCAACPQRHAHTGSEQKGHTTNSMMNNCNTYCAFHTNTTSKEHQCSVNENNGNTNNSSNANKVRHETVEQEGAHASPTHAACDVYGNTECLMQALPRDCADVLRQTLSLHYGPTAHGAEDRAEVSVTGYVYPDHTTALDEAVVNYLTPYRLSEMYRRMAAEAAPAVSFSHHTDTRLYISSSNNNNGTCVNADHIKTQNRYDCCCAPENSPAMQLPGSTLRALDVFASSSTEMSHASAEEPSSSSSSPPFVAPRETSATNSYVHTLMGLLNHTVTESGARMLRKWIAAPLTSRPLIIERQEGVMYLASKRWAAPVSYANTQEGEEMNMRPSSGLGIPVNSKGSKYDGVAPVYAESNDHTRTMSRPHTQHNGGDDNGDNSVNEPNTYRKCSNGPAAAKTEEDYVMDDEDIANELRARLDAVLRETSRCGDVEAALNKLYAQRCTVVEFGRLLRLIRFIHQTAGDMVAIMDAAHSATALPALLQHVVRRVWCGDGVRHWLCACAAEVAMTATTPLEWATQTRRYSSTVPNSNHNNNNNTNYDDNTVTNDNDNDNDNNNNNNNNKFNASSKSGSCAKEDAASVNTTQTHASHVSTYAAHSPQDEDELEQHLRARDAAHAALQAELCAIRHVLHLPGLEYRSIAGVPFVIDLLSSSQAKRVPATWIVLSRTKTHVRYHTPEIVARHTALCAAKEKLAAAAARAWRARQDALTRIPASHTAARMRTADTTRRTEEEEHEYNKADEEGVVPLLRRVLAGVATLDALHSLSVLARRPDYCLPVLVPWPDSAVHPSNQTVQNSDDVADSIATAQESGELAESITIANESKSATAAAASAASDDDDDVSFGCHDAAVPTDTTTQAKDATHHAYAPRLCQSTPSASSVLPRVSSHTDKAETTQTRVMLSLTAARHPVLDGLLRGHYVSCSVQLCAGGGGWLLTGPNMGGKSALMRMVGLLCVMAQMGSCVPARSAQLPIFAAIHTRMGASDAMLSGSSTFMTEMQETSRILRSPHLARSLVLMDELGRGTSSFDGAAVAMATLDHLVSHGATVMFVTHYSYLCDPYRDDGSAAEEAEATRRRRCVECYFMGFWTAAAAAAAPPASASRAAGQMNAGKTGRTSGMNGVKTENQETNQEAEAEAEEGGAVNRASRIVFTYQPCRGVTPSSFGIEIAKLAGLPERVTREAATMSQQAERAHVARTARTDLNRFLSESV